MFDTPQSIEIYNLRVLRSAVQLEKLGMKRSRRPSATRIAKKRFKLHTNDRDVIMQHITDEIERLRNED